MKKNFWRIKTDEIEDLRAIQAAIEHFARMLTHPEPGTRISKFDIDFQINIIKGLLHLRELTE